MNTRERDQFFNEVEASIVKHGFMTMLVMNDGENKGWMYTVGLSQMGLPEIIVGGASEHLHIPIHVLVKRAREKGEIALGNFSDLGLVLRTGGDLRFAVREVIGIDTVIEEYALQVKYRYPEQRKFVQLLWADGNNILPGEVGYDYINFPQKLF